MPLLTGKCRLSCCVEALNVHRTLQSRIHVLVCTIWHVIYPFYEWIFVNFYVRNLIGVAIRILVYKFPVWHCFFLMTSLPIKTQRRTQWSHAGTTIRQCLRTRRDGYEWKRIYIWVTRDGGHLSNESSSIIPRHLTLISSRVWYSIVFF